MIRSITIRMFIVAAAMVLSIAQPAYAASGHFIGPQVDTPLMEAQIDAHPEAGYEDTGLGDNAYSAAHETHGDGHKKTSGLPQLDPTSFPSQIFWLLLTFGLLYVALSKRILPEISSVLEGRREKIKSDLDSAQKLKNEAEKVHAAYEESLNEAHKQSSALFAKTEDEIKKLAAKEQARFKDASAETLEKAEKEIQKLKKEALQDMDQIAAEIASLAAEKIAGIPADVAQAKSVIKNMNKKAA